MNYFLKENVLGEPEKIFKASTIKTKLGDMIAISDDNVLYLLEFVDGRGVKREIENLKLKEKASIIMGVTEPNKLIKAELKSYFDGLLRKFTTPLHLVGSAFQKQVWKELMRIPYGETKSYATQAEAIGKSSAYRAVANANGANQIAIAIPCHRIIRSNGDLGGYGGGISRKQWLIEHEKSYYQ